MHLLVQPVTSTTVSIDPTGLQRQVEKLCAAANPAVAHVAEETKWQSGSSEAFSRHTEICTVVRNR